MPMRPPRICGCGHTIAAGQPCPCQRERALRRHDGRPSASSRGYDREWSELAAEHRRLHPFCVKCGAPVQIVDHIKSVRERPDLRLERSNLQSLCRRHHAIKTHAETKARGEGRGFGRRGADRSPPTARNSSEFQSVGIFSSPFFGGADL